MMMMMMMMMMMHLYGNSDTVKKPQHQDEVNP